MTVYVVWYEEQGEAHCYECGGKAPITRMRLNAIFATKENAHAYTDGQSLRSDYHIEEIEVKP